MKATVRIIIVNYIVAENVHIHNEWTNIDIYNCLIQKWQKKRKSLYIENGKHESTLCIMIIMNLE